MPAKSRRAAPAGSPSIVKPWSGARNEAAFTGCDGSRHTRTSVEVTIQLRDAGDRGDRQ